jgi:hypothetical protein
MKRVESAKIFMFVCIGLLALAGIFHLVAADAVAQSPDPGAVVSGWYNISIASNFVLTANGDLYRASSSYPDQWLFVTNVFDSAGTVSASGTSLGDIKQQFR